MDAFEYLFGFYGLLLGLALANVATGFADMWRSRDEVAIGTLIPLMCAAIVTYVASQWMGFWVGRNAFTISPVMLLVAMAITLPYIFASQVMFPRRPERWPSLDAYFLDHRAVILLPLLPAPVFGIGANVFYLVRTGEIDGDFTFYSETVLRVVLTIALPAWMVLKPHLRLHRIGLGLIVAFNLFRLFNNS